MTGSSAALAGATDRCTPSTWLLTGHRAGDNNQVLALAEQLGWPFEVKQLVHRRSKLLTRLISRQLFGITLAGIERRRSSELAPPWPQLVISAGRDSEPVARWIRRQSGDRTRLVHIGRPWAPLSTFDLVITTPQYFLPPRPNVLTNQLPLHRITPARLAAAAARWQPRLAHLPRPRTAVLVGGDSGSFVLTRDKARRLGRLVEERVRRSGGSALVSSSARTPAHAFEALCAQLDVPSHVYHWRPDDDDNPYLAYLALADELVVTGESASMLTEASVTQKPLFVFDIGSSGGARRLPRELLLWDLRKLRNRVANHFSPPRMQRDIGDVQRRLVASGRARWLGDAPAGSCGRLAHCDTREDARRTVERVRALFE
ncbi:MAG TPA: nucleoside-diphosphate sugar epimerase [Gammaproteobacteria bacterium]|nr:nucleoside-diphosphate sugar epimerase [Gammaproteobacteria bacterium]